MEGQGNTEYVVNLRHAGDGLLAKGSKARHTKLYSTLEQLSIVSLGQLLAEVVEKVPRRRGRSNNGIDGLAKWNLCCARSSRAKTIPPDPVGHIPSCEGSRTRDEARFSSCLAPPCLTINKDHLSPWRVNGKVGP